MPRRIWKRPMWSGGAWLIIDLTADSSHPRAPRPRYLRTPTAKTPGGGSKASTATPGRGTSDAAATQELAPELLTEYNRLGGRIPADSRLR